MMYAGPTRTNEPLAIDAAHTTPTSVRFSLGDRLPMTQARLGEVKRKQLALHHRETVVLNGWVLNGSDIDALMAAMRQAQTVPDDLCDDCGVETSGTALCEPCAQRRYDIEHEKLTDRAREWTP